MLQQIATSGGRQDENFRLGYCQLVAVFWHPNSLMSSHKVVKFFCLLIVCLVFVRAAKLGMW